MAILSDYARRRKLERARELVRPGDAVLEIGAGDGRFARELSHPNYRTLDLRGPADWVGDVRRWRDLGVPAASFDLILAFEVLEHVDAWEAIRDLLKPGGRLFATSPAPRWDRACAALEAAGLSQRRTSPHDHLVDFAAVTALEPVRVERFWLLSQWGLFRRA
ncbi:MAG: class I SAM-dependent methyltransferase [Elusimicrobiota bacterium]|nr:MAG: class I SAM-dependent methyltransferase [Elusimicrobiota bacterium]